MSRAEDGCPPKDLADRIPILREITAHLSNRYPLKGWISKQLDGITLVSLFAKATSDLDELPEDLLNNPKSPELDKHLDSLLVSARQVSSIVTQCAKEEGKAFSEHADFFQKVKESGMIPLRYSLQVLIKSVLAHDNFHGRLERKAKDLSRSIEEVQEKCAKWAGGFHTLEGSWKKDLAQDAALDLVLKVGQEAMGKTSPEELDSGIKTLEQAWKLKTRCGTGYACMYDNIMI